MAPKTRSGLLKVVGSVVETTKKVVEETVQVVAESTKRGPRGEEVKTPVKNIVVEDKAVDQQEETQIIVVEDKRGEVKREEEDKRGQRQQDEEEHEQEKVQASEPEVTPTTIPTASTPQIQPERKSSEVQHLTNIQERKKVEEREVQKEKNQEAKEGGKKRERKGGEESGNKRRKRRRLGEKGGVDGGSVAYKTYLYRLLKQLHPELGVSSMAMTVLNNLMSDMFERQAVEAVRLLRYTERRTMTSREIQVAVRLVLPGELGKHAIAEGSKAVSNYLANVTAGGSKS